MVVTFFLSGCKSNPAREQIERWQPVAPAMACEGIRHNNKVVPLSPTPLDPGKPVLLLIHGATDDPSEMLDIFRQSENRYNVFLFAFNFHHPVKRIGFELVKQIRAMQKEYSFATNMTVIDYSYSAIVFRQAVLCADEELFVQARIIQLVPTSGGSFMARMLKSHWASFLVSMASNVSAAQNPYGRISREVWGQEGTKKFNERVKSVESILVEGDPHCLANISDPRIRQMYTNGISHGEVFIIPRSTGANHDNFPTNPVVLQFLKGVLAPEKTVSKVASAKNLGSYKVPNSP